MSKRVSVAGIKNAIGDVSQEISALSPILALSKTLSDRENYKDTKDQKSLLEDLKGKNRNGLRRTAMRVIFAITPYESFIQNVQDGHIDKAFKALNDEISSTDTLKSNAEQCLVDETEECQKFFKELIHSFIDNTEHKNGDFTKSVAFEIITKAEMQKNKKGDAEYVDKEVTELDKMFDAAWKGDDESGHSRSQPEDRMDLKTWASPETRAARRELTTKVEHYLYEKFKK